jgi:hypothetical protein
VEHHRSFDLGHVGEAAPNSYSPRLHGSILSARLFPAGFPVCSLYPDVAGEAQSA